MKIGYTQYICTYIFFEINIPTYIYIYILCKYLQYIYVPWSKVTILEMVISPLIGILIMGI